MKLRDISEQVVISVFSQADARFEDVQLNTFVAVKRVTIAGKEKDVALIYRESDDEILLITLHPLKERQKENRIQSGRWIRRERS